MRSGNREQGGTRMAALVFRLELKFLYVFLRPCCFCGGSNSSPLVLLPIPALSPRLVWTVYSENVPGLARSLSKHVISPDTDRKAALTWEEIDDEKRRITYMVG